MTAGVLVRGRRTVCRNQQRLRVLEQAGGLSSLNAIEYVEVRDTDEPDLLLRQRTLYVRLIRPVPATITAAHVRIAGGDRVATVPVEWAAPADAGSPPVTGAAWTALVAGLDQPDHVLVVRTALRGDFSTYDLALREPGTDDVPAGFDTELTDVALQFKVECPTDSDCAADAVCDGELDRTGPRIDYLAKDFDGFRRIMLERLALLSPAWSERNPADQGVALVELLAYVADGLSWRQDAIATEGYLATARSRISLRRHARLVDYRIHEGSAARAWLRVTTDAGTANLPAGTPVCTAVPGFGARVAPADATDLLRDTDAVFETCADAQVHEDLAELRFHGWGEERPCLPAGATTATLRGHHPLLAVGDVLVLAQVRDPETDEASAADPGMRHAVRLVAIDAVDDPAGGLFEVPPTSAATAVTRITWHPEDALPWSLPLTHPRTDGQPDDDAALAWGNIVLADHGRAVGPELLAADGRLAVAGLVFQRPLPDPSAPLPSAAATLATSDPRGALPALRVTGERSGVTEEWEPRPDLLASGAADPHFVVEVDTDRSALLRFGRGGHGRPADDTTFTVRYRVGDPATGNVGLDTLRHVITTSSAILDVTNPLPARGGQAPETPEEIRRDAPEAFRRQERAVTMADYAEVTERSGLVQRAAATLRWTGSWHTVFVTADRAAGAAVDADFERRVRDWVEPYRMAGYDLEVDAPVFVALDLALLVCVERRYLRADVGDAVREVLSAGVRADGTLGLFHPDRFTFGQPVHLSMVVAAVQAVEGVDSVRVTTFQRLGSPSTSGLAAGVLPMGRLEIPRLDDDPNYPDRGRLVLTLGGGR